MTARRITASLLATVLLAALPAGLLAAEEKKAEAKKDEAFRPLLDEGLSKWKADEKLKEHWTLEGDVLKYDGKAGHLWTKESFEDFVLKVDWRLPAKGDSGIYLRGMSKAQCNIWVNKLGSGEVWGYRVDENQPEDIRKACTPSKVADKPVGEWNTFVITMKGDRLTVVLNGEEVISEARLPDVKPSGPIALQHHGNPIEFRNIVIKELGEKKAK